MSDVDLCKSALCTKYVLIFMNLIFFASGVTLLGLGVWIIATPYQLDILAILENPIIQNGVYVLIAVGAFIIVISGLGLFGACRHSQCMLVVYFILVLLIFIVQIVSASLVNAYRSHVDAFVTDSLDETMDNYAGENATDTYSTAWNAMQVLLGCCGTYNYTDWASTTWGASSSEDYPLTCCVYDDPDTLLTGTDWPKPANSSACLGDYGPPDSTVLNMGGCYDSFAQYINNNIIFIGSVGIGFIGIEISCLCMAISLCCAIRKASK